MKRPSLTREGFSLVEVILTISVVSFAFVGLLGLFPVAIEQSRASVDATRGAQIARMVMATLGSQSFIAAECFGPEGGSTLNLDKLTESDLVVLYASYDVRAQASIVRSDTPPPNAEYRVELSFQQVRTSPPDPSDPPGPVRGSLVGLKILGEPARKRAVFETSEFIGRSSRAVFAK